MAQNNLNRSIDPDDALNIDPLRDSDQDDTDEGYDILPSNGPGLAGDDGEQVVDDEEDFDEDEDGDDDDDE